jgi:hypothetical protein
VEGRREGRGGICACGGRDIQGVRLDKAAWTVGGGIANAFFNSLERYSCVALSVTDSDDEEGVAVNQRHCARLGMGLEKAPEESSGIGALRLVGCERFVRQNPKTDRFPVQRFHHIEFWYVFSVSFYPRFPFFIRVRCPRLQCALLPTKPYGSILIVSEHFFSFIAR